MDFRKGRAPVVALAIVAVLAVVVPAHADTYSASTGGHDRPDLVPGNGTASHGGSADQYGDVSVSASVTEALGAGLPFAADAPLPGQSLATGRADVMKEFEVSSGGAYTVTATFAPVTGATTTRDDPSLLGSASLAQVAANLDVRLRCTLPPCAQFSLARATTQIPVSCSSDGSTTCTGPGGVDLTGTLTVPQDGDFVITADAFLSTEVWAHGSGRASSNATATIYRIYIERTA